jgi:hypothetical protein
MLLTRTGGRPSRMQDKLPALFVSLGLVIQQRDASTPRTPETVIEHGLQQFKSSFYPPTQRFKINLNFIHPTPPLFSLLHISSSKFH